MPSKWAYEIAMEQRRDVETMATNLDAARAQGRREGLEEAVKIVATAGRYVYARDIAIEIRARINQEGK